MQLELYVNDKRFFVVKVTLAGLESEHGLCAYMALLLHRHPIVRSFQLTKVVQHWSITPGDGFVYFASAPPPYPSCYPRTANVWHTVNIGKLAA